MKSRFDWLNAATNVATILGVILTLHAIERVRAGASVRRVLWLVPVFILWANIHVQVVLGLGLLGLAALFQAIPARRPGSLAWLTLACTIATLCNPYHVRLWEVVVEYATQTAALKEVREHDGRKGM